MKGTGAERNVCPGSCVSTGAKFPVAPVESAPMSTIAFCQACVYLRSSHQMALPVNGSTRLIPAYYSFYRPRKDERLSWPSWLQ